MTIEEKQLLLKDLCSRLPYGVVAQVIYKDGEGWKTEDRKVLGVYTDGQVYANYVYTNIENTKPYLRPMSSMTEKEKKEFKNLFDGTFQIDQGVIISDSTKWNKNEAVFVDDLDCTNLIDWLISNHFDFRCLIPMSLALKAPKDMYKEK